MLRYKMELEVSIDEILAPSNDCRLLPLHGKTADKVSACERLECQRRLEEAEREIQMFRWQQGFLNEDF